MAARDLVEQQRAEQLLRDAKLAADLAKQYGPAWERMRTEILQILAVVEKTRAAGETVDTRWLLRKGYLDRLEKLVTFQTRTFLDFTARKVQESSVQAALDGQRDAAELVAEAAPGDVPKPLLETSYAVNNLAAGKPLRHLLDSLPGQVGSQAAGALLEGVVLGLGPREIARDIRKVATIPLTRALLISRTETLRVYRQAAFDRYRQSSDILTGWVWLAKLDDRTCPVCIALHGTKHELSEEMATHPNCRCSMAPLTEPWTDPDLPDTRFAPQTGEAWFKNLSPERQRSILGPGKFALYESGELTLADLVQPTEHVVWGKGVRERSLRDLGGSTIPEVPATVGITPEPELAVPKFTSVAEAKAWAEQHIADTVVVRDTARPDALRETFQGIQAGLAGSRRIDYLNLAWNGRKEVIAGPDGRPVNISGGSGLAEAGWFQSGSSMPRGGRGDLEPFTFLRIRASHLAKPDVFAEANDADAFIASKAQRIVRIQDAIADPRRKHLIPLNERKLRVLEETERWTLLSDSERPLFAMSAHEASHIRDYNANFGGSKSLPFGETSNSWQVSEYAASNRRELFAEVGAAIAEGRSDLVPPNILEAFLKFSRETEPVNA